MTIKWTPELEDTIAKRLINRSLRRICEEDKDLPSRAAINERLTENEEFWTKCARARRIQAMQRLESVELDVDSCNADNARAVAVKVSYAQWFAEKALPKEYGAKLAHTGADGDGPVKLIIEHIGSDGE
jgi:hypothetical protein